MKWGGHLDNIYLAKCDGTQYQEVKRSNQNMLNMFHKFDLIAGKGKPIHLKSNSFSPTQIVRLLTFFLVEKKHMKIDS